MTVLFPTCLAELLRPGLADRLRAVLGRRGIAADVTKGVGCCGQPAYNAGYLAAARSAARPTLRALAKTTGPIVVPSGSCTAMMARHWPTLFANTRHEANARDVAARVVELSQFLASHTPPQEAAAHKSPVAYHGSCHLERELDVRRQPRALLAEAGHDVRDPDHADLCCGFGGTFSVKLAGVSTAMADEKLDCLLATGADTVVGCDLSCLVHLESRARRRGLPLTFAHLADVLDG